MFDEIQRPDVTTNVKIGNFVLHCVAYRKLTKSELRQCARLWLLKNHRRSFPKNGSGTILTTYGHNLE